MNWLPLIAEGEGPPPFIQQMGPMLPLMIILGVMFILMMRTNARQRREAQAMLANLKKNDKVLTSSGILGVIVALKENEDEVTLKVDETTNTRIRVLKSSILRVTSEEQSAQNQPATTETKPTT